MCPNKNVASLTSQTLAAQRKALAGGCVRPVVSLFGVPHFESFQFYRQDYIIIAQRKDDDDGVSQFASLLGGSQEKTVFTN